VMNDGTELVAPWSVARATCGLGRGSSGAVSPGLLPPAVGWAWHIAQALPLKVGPKPFPFSMFPETETGLAKRRNAWLKRDSSLALRVR
jgi:hypothetical protein